MSACTCPLRLSTCCSWVTACFSSASTWEPRFAICSPMNPSETSWTSRVEWTRWHDDAACWLQAAAGAGCRVTRTTIDGSCYRRFATASVLIAAASQPSTFVDYDLCSATMIARVVFVFANAARERGCMKNSEECRCTRLTVNSTRRFGKVGLVPMLLALIACHVRRGLLGHVRHVKGRPSTWWKFHRRTACRGRCRTLDFNAWKLKLRK